MGEAKKEKIMNDKQIISNLEFQVSARNSRIKELEAKIALLKSKSLEKNKQIRDLKNKNEQLEDRIVELNRQVQYQTACVYCDNQWAKKPKSYSEMMKSQGRW